jgi:hypothetical protein
VAFFLRGLAEPKVPELLEVESFYLDLPQVQPHHVNSASVSDRAWYSRRFHSADRASPVQHREKD